MRRDGIQKQLQKQHITYRLTTTALTLGLVCEWFDMWWLYTNIDTRRGLVQGMNKYPNFFRYNAEAQLRCVLSALVTLYDRGRGRVTLQSLVEEVGWSSVELSRLKRMLEAGAALAKKMEALRHNLIAHRSDRHTYQDAYAEARLTPNQIKRAITISCVIYNAVARKTKSPVFYRQHRSRDEMVGLVAAGEVAT